MKVIVTPKATKQFKHVPKADQIKIKRRLKLLEEDSQAGKKLSGEFEGVRSLRAWPYRLLYIIDKKQDCIFVITISHRQGVYK